MIRDVRRYARAFWTALVFTLRGQKPPSLVAEESHADLIAWCRRTVALVNAAEGAIRSQQVAPTAIVMHIEGRDVTLDYALSVVKFHAAREYPHLVRSSNPHAVLAIQASNMNDRFLIQRMSEHDALPSEIRKHLDSINEHLSNISS